MNCRDAGSLCGPFIPPSQCDVGDVMVGRSEVTEHGPKKPFSPSVRIESLVKLRDDSWDDLVTANGRRPSLRTLQWQAGGDLHGPPIDPWWMGPPELGGVDPFTCHADCPPSVLPDPRHLKA